MINTSGKKASQCYSERTLAAMNFMIVAAPRRGALLKIYDRDFDFDGEYHLEMVASMIWRKVASSSLLARYGNRARAWFSVLSAFV